MKSGITKSACSAAAACMLLAAGHGALGGWQSAASPGIRHLAPAVPQVAPGALQILDKQGQAAAMCPLKHTDVAARIDGYASRVTVTQEFGNPSTTPVEAVYTFPLPEDAAVDDMTMVIGKRVVKGVILRREEARQVYETARARGQSAALLDQERPNIFTQSVANIMPGDRIRITISYVNILKYEEGVYEFSFPMVVGPRYTPGGGYGVPGRRGAPSPRKTIDGDPGGTAVVTDAEKITPPIAPENTRAGHDISVTVDLDAGLPLQQVKCVSHPVRIRSVGPSRAVVTLQDEAAIPNKDFVLRYSAAGSQVAEGILTYARPGGHGGYFTLVIQPPMAPPRTVISPKEMVFVLDQTGSQSGWPIKKSKETMAYCIRNLNPGDTFQLIGFNTEVYPCFPRPVPATPETINQALKWMEPLEGNGGTDILKSVDYALKIPEDPGRLRIVCYMTDGYVGNDMQIVDYVGKHRGTARMFPFGIGSSVNRFLIEGMAREGKGASDYVFLDAPGMAHAQRFYRRIASPLLLDPKVDWGGLPVTDVYPRQIPDVFTSRPVILKGRYTGAAEGDIVVSGLLQGQPWSRTIHVRLPALTSGGSAIATLWGREKIDDLQNQDWVGAQTGNPKPDIKDAITNVALEYRLMSQYTSFVAVEQRVVNLGGKQRTVDVPVEMPEGVSHQGIFGERSAEGRQAANLLGRMDKMPKVAGNAFVGARSDLGANGTYTDRDGRYHPLGTNQAVVHSFGLRVDRNGHEQKVPLLADVPMVGAPFGTKPGAGPAGPTGDKGKEAGGVLAVSRPSGEVEGIRLSDLKPAEQRAVLRKVKLSPALQARITRVGSSKLTVQVWISRLPQDGMRKLKAVGFELAATLRPGALLLGSISIAKLDRLLQLGFVQAVEEPRLR